MNSEKQEAKRECDCKDAAPVTQHVISEGTNYANSFSANRDHINPVRQRQKETEWAEMNKMLHGLILL